MMVCCTRLGRRHGTFLMERVWVVCQGGDKPTPVPYTVGTGR